MMTTLATRNDLILPPAYKVNPLGQNEAHIWVVELTELQETSILENDVAVLSSEERLRLERFYFEKDRHTFLISHLLLRMALTACVPEVVPAEWVFARSPNGRPEIIHPKLRPRLRFNISHTHGLVACLVTTEIDCGLDIEIMNRATDVTAIAESVLAPSELASMSTLPVEERTHRFFSYWTLKEAYAKARGLGMSLPFNRCAFELSANSISPVLFDDNGEWQFEQWPATERHMLAIALRRGRRNRIHVIRRRDL